MKDVNVTTRCEVCEGKRGNPRLVSGRTKNLCDACCDIARAREAFHKQLVEVTQLEDGQDYEKALSMLDAILESNAELDHDGWLKRSVLAHRAYVLARHGRYGEALVAQRMVAQILGPQHPDYPANQLAIADTLERMGDLQGAVGELEAGLAAISADRAQDSWGLLCRYARMCGGQVSEAHRQRFEKAMRWWGIDVLSEAHHAQEPLGTLILRADQCRREAQKRYQDLLIDLRATDSEGEREQKILFYIHMESVEYFRTAAKRMLAGTRT